MNVDEVTIPSLDFPGGQTFGPVEIEPSWDGPADWREELPVAMRPRSRRFLGVCWYPEVYFTRGVFTVSGDRILIRPTAPIVVTRAAWWRRLGYRIFGRRPHARSTMGQRAREAP